MLWFLCVREQLAKKQKNKLDIKGEGDIEHYVSRSNEVELMMSRCMLSCQTNENVAMQNRCSFSNICLFIFIYLRIRLFIYA